MKIRVFCIQTNSSQFPAWANISKDWINRELTKYSFAPNLKISQNNNPFRSGDGLYTLFKQKEPSKQNTNYNCKKQTFGFNKVLSPLYIFKVCSPQSGG